LAKFSIFLIVLALVAGMGGCGGDGTPTVEIRDWDDLDAVRYNLGSNYLLMNDLDSTTANYTELASPTANQGKGWEPIGTFDDQFTGSFDGQGHNISDLFINRPDEDSVGLFVTVDEGGRIEDIGVVNADVTGHDCVGGLVGVNVDGTVSNSYSSGNVTGERDVGSLVGENCGTVSSSYSTGTVIGLWSIGGLVGWNTHGTVSNSYSTGSVTGYSNVGGLVGGNGYASTVSDSYSTGSATGDEYVGGLVGSHEYSTVSNSYYNYDEVLINGENIITLGALFGEDFDQWLANDKFLDVNERLSQENGYYLINDVSDFKQLLAFGQNDTLKFRLTNDLDLGDESNFYIPYLAGQFDGNGHKISDLSLNSDLVSPLGLFGYLAPSGKVTKVGVENINITGYSGVGGLVGVNGGTVSNSYSTGSVTGNEDVGGLVGWNNEGAVSNSFWDIETSATSTSDGGTGKTTAEMQDIATFSGAGWNITAVANPGTRNPSYVWNIVDDETYPFLGWQ
jgi:hypothetical protein